MSLVRMDRSLRRRGLLGALLVLSVAAPALASIMWDQGNVPFLSSFRIYRGGAPVARHPDEAPFRVANERAMARMMTGMAVKSTDDVDADFTATMIPHHQGAIEMAEAELRFGCNKALRRTAQEIIVDQQGEIAAMRLALGQPLPPSAPAPTGGGAPPSQSPGNHPSPIP